MYTSFIAKEITYRKLLEHIPKIVDNLAEKQPRAPEQFMNWLKEAEQSVQEHNTPAASELAAIRSKLCGQKYQKTTRKEQLQVCCNHLADAQAVIYSAHEKVNQPIEQARTLLAPLLTAIAQSGAKTYGQGDDFQAFVESIAQLLNQHEQLKTSMVHVNSLLNKQDCLRLLADMIDLNVWSKTKSVA